MTEMIVQILHDLIIFDGTVHSAIVEEKEVSLWSVFPQDILEIDTLRVF